MRVGTVVSGEQQMTLMKDNMQPLGVLMVRLLVGLPRRSSVIECRSHNGAVWTVMFSLPGFHVSFSPGKERQK